MPTKLTWLLFLGIAGCGGGALAPSYDLASDPLVLALPPGTTLLVGIDARSLRQAPAFGAAIAHSGIDLPALERRLRERGGLSSGADAVAQARIGCGDQGCAALVEGDLHGLSVPWVAT
ncbi:MAG: hypothetical protein JXR83_11975, partial [Deltaproteobacteria bacterium]|nr:hypothetical protein [Deltaproteobacteria bacterium]